MDRRYSIKELVDIDRLRWLFEEFSKATGFTTGLVSYPEQELLIATGWRDICTKFHRACPASAECCKESNIYLTECLKDLKELSIKPCGNGLVDGATPVVIRGVHLASLATGQVLLNQPDPEFFKGLARKYGYNTEEYLAALSQVPVVSEEQLKNALSFLSGMAVLIAEQGLNRLRREEATEALRAENAARKQAEEKLAAQQFRFAGLMENTPDLIYFKDRESRFTYINEALARAFGLDNPEDALGKSDFDYLTESHARIAYESEQRIIATGEPIMDVEERDPRLDNRIQWVSTTKIPLRDASGNIKGIVGISRDITARKHAEENLAAQQQRFAGLMESTPDFIFFKDRESRFTCINEAKAHKLGFASSDEIVGKSDFDFFHETHARAAYESEQRIMATGEPSVDLEEMEVWPDGHVTWVSTTKIPLRDASGNIEGIVGISRDITARKQAEETLKQSEAKTLHLNAVLRAIRDVQGLILNEHNAPRLLDGVCNVLVHTRGYLSAWVGKPEQNSKRVIPVAFAGIGAAILKEVPITWDESPNGQGPCGCAIRERTPAIFNNIADDPRVAPWAAGLRAAGCFSIASLPLLHNDRLFGAITVKADRPQAFTQEEITLLKGMADEIAHALQSIENKEERKRTEEQLRQTQKMESIGQLAGGIAHDFNNILGATMLQINLLQEHPNMTAELRSLVNELEVGTTRASNLTRQLLLFSRRQAIQIKPMELNETLDDLLKMLNRIMGEHVKLTLEGEGAPIWIEADKGMMEQMVMNLCVNARDAMEHGGCIVISTRYVQIGAVNSSSATEARPGNFACLSVADTGCGIEAENLKQIFEPFFTTKEVGKGTGLGLATVYGIIKQHQGWIEVESAVGKGSVFHVFLPSHPAPSPRQSQNSKGQLQHGHETILIAEDDKSLRMMLAMSLRRLGYRVLEAGDGMEAIRQWNQHAGEIDLLIADMIMPGGMSGLDIITQIRQTTPKFKAIISSGYSSEIARLSAAAKSGVVILSKPYEADALAATVRQTLDQG